jgi:hypothetical protein
MRATLRLRILSANTLASAGVLLPSLVDGASSSAEAHARKASEALTRSA